MSSNKHRHHEIHTRSIIKAVTWKILASGFALAITYYYTGSFDIAGKTAGTTFFVGFLVYYLHERLWNAIHWGKHTHVDD